MSYEGMNPEKNAILSGMERNQSFTIDVALLSRLKKEGGIDAIVGSPADSLATIDALRLIGAAERLYDDFGAARQEILALRGDVISDLQNSDTDWNAIRAKLRSYAAGFSERFQYARTDPSANTEPEQDDVSEVVVDEFAQNGYAYLARVHESELPAKVTALEAKFQGVSVDWLMSQAQRSRAAVVEYLGEAAQELLDTQADQAEGRLDSQAKQAAEESIDESIMKAHAELDTAIQWLAL